MYPYKRTTNKEDWPVSRRYNPFSGLLNEESEGWEPIPVAAGAALSSSFEALAPSASLTAMSALSGIGEWRDYEKRSIAAMQTVAGAALSSSFEALAPSASLTAMSALSGIGEWRDYEKRSIAAMQTVAQTSLTGAFKVQASILPKVGNGLAEALNPALDLGKSTADWLHTQLTHSDLRIIENPGLARMAQISFTEGIPFIGVLPAEVEDELLEATNADDRVVILGNRQQDILDYCLRALFNMDNETVNQCRVAIKTLKYGTYQPAQSHAANIADSIVRHLYGKRAKHLAEHSAIQDVMDLPLSRIRDNLVLRPVNLALTSWEPRQGIPMPERFSRHVTAHAVGRSGVFSKEKALIAVMLAVSLTCHFQTKLPG